ncbi:acyl-CoA synthetase [Streptomyces albiflavescens]|uniref:Acyl-CoA synthetase n=1 Tax=Streptomyces albiflavescens TaxID=1623582 RepID=A0A918D451_9ACTN|nr:fatty acyl-AMP ligase [Streptomyces albiflavescens]GGN62842.1 acyl-CoA synthetase [Streptomyces albiflavescens]
MTSARPDADAPLPDHLRYWALRRPQQRAFSHVHFPNAASEGLHRTLGWRALDARARAVADRLVALVAPGDRAALVMPQGLDYAAAFLGCLYARVIAVPLFGPQLPGHESRLAAVLADCEPACLLSDSTTAIAVEAFVLDHDLPVVPVVPVDQLALQRFAFDEVEDVPAPDDIAYLQYTSGSTSEPAGVMISHANVVANARQAIDAFGVDPGATTTVGWLPLFHDMGLVLSIAAPVVGGFPSVLMDPVAFLEEPARWLRLLSAYDGTIGAAPNFAYDYCVARTDPAVLDELRLDRVRVLINGSEPVRQGTIDRFHATFAPAGLNPATHAPAYGLAEATVFVTADAGATPPTTVVCDAGALAEGRVEVLPDAEDAAVLVSCGVPAGQEVEIVDADGERLPEDCVGEIRLRGPNIGRGYWKRADRAFCDPQGRLRTGDLGAVHDGRLLVTGRLKDVIIVDGRNHYPQDIERTVEISVDVVRQGRLAAFGVPRADSTGEQLVVVAEHRRGAEPTADAARQAERTVRAAVSARHGLRLGGLLIVPPGSVPRTSSGKVARTAARARYLDGGFDPR